MSETLSSGLTLIIPSEGDSNWASSIKANCFQKISEHDHTGSGKGVQISTNAIANGAITEGKLGAGSVTTAKIADLNITEAKLIAALAEKLIPTGMIAPCALSSAPAGWLLCDGSAISRTTYAALFTAIGESYGAGNGSTTFNLPNLQGRFPLGKATSGTGSTLAGTGGSLDHEHTVPAHYHEMAVSSTLSVDIDHNHPSFNTAANIVRVDGTGTSIPTDAGATYLTTHSVIPIDVPALGATPKTPTGAIGLVSGGSNGNASMTSGANNPPFQVVNYIIKT
jgi:microcystin-dependent protein